MGTHGPEMGIGHPDVGALQHEEGHMNDDERCRRHTVYGSRCELEREHDGPHQRSMTMGRPYTWTDESQTKLMGDRGTAGT